MEASIDAEPYPMSEPASPTPEMPRVFPHLARTRNAVTVYLLRMLIRLDAFHETFRSRSTSQVRAVLERLRIPQGPLALTEADVAGLHARLQVTLRHLESTKRRFVLPRTLESNLQLLGRQFSLSLGERAALALAVLMRNDEIFATVASHSRHQVNVVDQIAAITGLPGAAIRRAFAPRSNLRKSGLVDVGGGGPPNGNLSLRRGGLRVLAMARLKSVDEIFSSFVTPGQPAKLEARHYAHLVPGFDVVHQLLGEALGSGRRGVNLLLYGPPGTGKTELARTLAHSTDAMLYEVSHRDEDGNPLIPPARLANTTTAQELLAGRKALLVYDEADAIFNGRSHLTDLSAADQIKASVNELLEDNGVPTIWIANSIGRMDPAFTRRFDLVIKLDAPPLSQRLRMTKDLGGETINAEQALRLARSPAVTPAIVARALDVAARLGSPHASAGALVEGLVDSVLVAQGHRRLRHGAFGSSAADFRPDWCHASVDLAALADGIAASGAGRICLYGPPGTGKTAFGHWLAAQLDRPILLKRASDLDSSFVGQMEQNLAQAFEEAAAEDAVLQIDEVDSFLRHRVDAQRGWEVSRVNEFLTQLESFEGIFVASTNLIDAVDPAAMRRFDHAIHFGFARADQTLAMLRHFLGRLGLEYKDDALHRAAADLASLTPGDFTTLERRHRIAPFASTEGVLEALREESRRKPGVVRKVGFV